MLLNKQELLASAGKTLLSILLVSILFFNFIFLANYLESGRYTNLIQNLAYGKKENIIKSMSDCKMSDIIFTLASSLGGDIIYAFKEGNKDDTSVIFADIFSIIAAIFDGIDVPNLILKSRSVIAEDLNSKRSFKKPIRHGRFSGSVCVQLSVITECLTIYSYYNFRRVKIWLLAIATCLHRELPDL